MNAAERFKTRRPSSPLLLDFFAEQVVQLLLEALDGQTDHV